METKHSILVNSKQGIQFKFSIFRKITVIRGESATGKSTLYQMILDGNSKQNVGVSISCDVSLKVLNEDTYERDLNEQEGNIFILDEDFSYIRTKEFARAVNKSNNCFIFITREALPGIPYSYKEIYKIKCSGKYHSLSRMYENYDDFQS